ncbi:MAG: hypothetical protein R2911_36185 [Caldilineaceae bacterium]
MTTRGPTFRSYIFARNRQCAIRTARTQNQLFMRIAQTQHGLNAG